MCRRVIKRQPGAFPPVGGGFIQRTIPGEKESFYFHLFVLKKVGGFMIASEQSTAPHAYKDHLSHSWGEEQRLTVSH